MERRGLVLVAALLGVAAVIGFSVGHVISPPSSPSEAEEVEVEAETATSMSSLPASELRPTDPASYPRTRAGAVAAATAYGLALDSPVLFQPAHRTVVLDRVAADDARDELAATFADGTELIAVQLDLVQHSASDPGFVWRVVPGGWQLRAYDRSGATVAIWAAVVVMVDDRLLVEPGWQTSTVELTWERDGWRLVGFRTEPGPNPAFAAGPGAVPVGQRINGFAAFRHWPEPPDEAEGQ